MRAHAVQIVCVFVIWRWKLSHGMRSEFRHFSTTAQQQQHTQKNHITYWFNTLIWINIVAQPPVPVWRTAFFVLSKPRTGHFVRLLRDEIGCSVWLRLGVEVIVWKATDLCASWCVTCCCMHSASVSNGNFDRFCKLSNRREHNPKSYRYVHRNLKKTKSENIWILYSIPKKLL